MIKSMTGYGKGQTAVDGLTVTVEVRSVNHRYGDVSVKAPRGLLASELEIKKRVAERLKRGKIDVFITQETAAGNSALPTLNLPLAEAYMQLFEKLARDFPLTGGVPLELLAGQRDVVLLQEGGVAEDALAGAVELALTAALDMLEKMRLAEGAATLADFEQRLATVEELLGQIESRAPQVPLEWQQRLKERLARYAQEIEIDPQRLAQELAVYADRCDISEELTRFRSHLQQFRTLFVAAEPVGRQLDFLVQELNREANTMGSKSNDAELTRSVVTLKSELEKIREQVQNVE
ncbi:YicC family protein [Desulfuromonas carbonis]|uniref:YicC/YloC family endoribonuclease n=1 Tax=Desulfuromonas sp. DDH964 TaxID=1823759 RepID=UPI00078D92D4|nr:YicC/YloC family endoribonuclease [Desulfuromonas sp. DDH964]AMV72646.1 hypothetical protein DBW_2309 [Desulfuromonas sp. DDH964]